MCVKVSSIRDISCVCVTRFVAADVLYLFTYPSDQTADKLQTVNKTNTISKMCHALF